MPPAVVNRGMGQHRRSQRQQPQKRAELQSQRPVAAMKAFFPAFQRAQLPGGAQKQHPQRRGGRDHVGQIVPWKPFLPQQEGRAPETDVVLPPAEIQRVFHKIAEKRQRFPPQRRGQQGVKSDESEKRRQSRRPDSPPAVMAKQLPQQHKQGA